MIINFKGENVPKNMYSKQTRNYMKSKTSIVPFAAITMLYRSRNT